MDGVVVTAKQDSVPAHHNHVSLVAVPTSQEVL